MTDLDAIFEQMSDKELEDYMEDWNAGIYCCSSECLDTPYLDCIC